MATITKPMALDESFNTTESTPRNQADVLAGIESAIRQGFGRSAADVSYDNTTSELTADDVQEAIDELAAEKVDKVEGKGLSSNDFTDEDKAALDNMELDIESTRTVTGNPLTLTDCAPINAESLVVELEPKQDLHGYDFPWVGGAGKNKLDCTLTSQSIAGMTITVDSEKRVTINGKCTFQDYAYLHIGDVNFKANVTYRLTGCPSGTNCIIYSSNMPSGFGNAIVDDGNGGEKTTSSDYSGIELFIRIPENEQLNNVVFEPMFRVKTDGDDTFASYSNICPITGYTECEVDDVGKNRFDESVMADTAVGTWGYAEIQLEPNTSYIMSSPDCNSYLADNTEPRLYFYIQAGTADTPNMVTKSNFVTQTTGADGIARVQWLTETSGKPITGYHFMLSKGTVSQTYEPYHPSNATIQFGQTVYGGRSNFTDGGTDDEWENVDLGDLSWTYRGDGLFSADLSDYAFESDVMAYCSGYRYMGTVDGASMATSNGSVYLYYNDGQSSRVIYVVDTQYTDAIVFKAAVTGIQFVYEKATPDTISTPPTDLKLLKGTNNITTNGTTITLGYQPDNVIGEVKGEIEKCAVDAEFAQFTDGNDTFTDVNLTLDGYSHTVSMVGSKIEQKRFICFEVTEIRSGAVQGILASCIAFTDGAKTPSGTAFRAYIESLQMYVNFRIYGSGGSYTLAYQSETSFSASAFYLRVRMMNNL